MNKFYNLIFVFIFQFICSQSQDIQSLGYLKNGIIEDANGRIITDSKLRDNAIKLRNSKVQEEQRSMKKGALPLVQMCTNGGFEQHEMISGSSFLKDFMYTIGDPPGPTQCRSISNKADAYIPQYDPSKAQQLMATTVPSNLIDRYMGDIKAWDQYALKINYQNSGTYGSVVQSKRFKTNNENFLKFNYKAVLQSVYDTSHTDNQAFFKARILDKNGKVISEFCLVGDEKNCIFTKVPDGSYGYVTLYTANWQAGILDISSIPNNEEFTVEFMASRCGLGGHFGYAYVDDICVSHTNESFVGSIKLDPLYAVCPSLPLNVCGTFTVPNSGGVVATVKKMTLSLYDSNGKVVHTSTAATIDAINKKFCFSLSASDFPDINFANYNVGVKVDYDMPAVACGGGNFFESASDNDANEGWDISFLNCNTSCNINVKTGKLSKCDVDQDGVEVFNLNDLNAQLVSSTTGLTFAYCKTFEDAFNNNPVASQGSFLSPSTTLYVRVSRDASCFKIIPVSLEVRNPSSQISGVLNVCSGSTQLTASEGATYLWSPSGETTRSITVTDVGTYTVVVTDSYGCSSTATVNIEPSNTAATPQLAITQPSCFVSFGKIEVTSAASQYSFDNGVTWTTNPVKANLSPGKFFVKVKTAKGCISYAQEVEIIPALLPYPSAYGDNPKFCGDTGRIIITSTAPFYSIDNGVTWVTTSTIDKLKPGKYFVRIKDVAGCISNAYPVDIVSRTLGDVDYKVDQPACTVKGKITINTPADYYTFDGGTTWVTSNFIDNLSAGTYNIGVKNYLGCVSNMQYVYLQKFENTNPDVEINQPQCGVDGTIYIKTEAAEYSFDGGATWTTSNLKQLPAGNYNIKIKNSAGCISQNYQVTLYVPALQSPIIYVEQPQCGVDGKVTINTYADFYSFDNGLTWGTSNSKVLPAGSYYILIKNNFGCVSYATSAYLNPAKLPKPQISIVQPTCNTKGSITILTPADFYSINNGSTWSTSPVFNNLTSNNYTIVVKNNLNCISDANFAYFNTAYLEEPIYKATSPSCGNTVGSIEILTPADQYSINSGNTWSSSPIFNSLSKGSYGIMIRKGGCSSSIKYINLSDYSLPEPSVSIVEATCTTKSSLTINATADFYSINGGSTWVTTPVFNNLQAGSYYIKVKNNNACESNTSYVNIKDFYLPDPVYSFTQPSCGVGGTITFLSTSQSYSIDGGKTWSASNVFTGLQPGSYYLMVKNSQNCTSSLYAATLSLNAVYIPNPDVQVIQPSCGNGGMIKILTPAAQYSFNGGSTWTTNPILNNPAPGYYNIVIKNSQNCISNPYVYNISILEYYLPKPLLKTVQPTCGNGGSITIVSDGDFYSFDNGLTWGTNRTLLNPKPGGYNIKIKNQQNCVSLLAYTSIQTYYASAPQTTVIAPTCETPSGTIVIKSIADLYSFDNGATWQTSPMKDKLPSGSYNVLTKNASGCLSQSSSVYISSTPNIPNAPVATIVQPTSCNTTDGSITITTPGISFSFNDGASWSTDPSKKNLGSGTYILKVKTNTYSCDSKTLIVNLNSGQYINAPDADAVQPTCSVSTGSIVIKTAGSTYSFDDGLTYVFANTKNNLLPGTYKVRIKDASGCLSLATIVTISNPAPLPAPALTIKQPDCNDAFGEITVNSPALEYSFDNGLTFVPSNVKTNLPAGSYNIIIKDASGCISLAAVANIKTQPVTPPIPQVSVSQPVGCSAINGRISIISPALFYSYDDGATWVGQASQSLPPGSYLVRVKLALDGCPSPALAIDIDTPADAPILPTYSITQPTTCVYAFGEIFINTVAPFYSYDNGITYVTATKSGPLPPGDYFIKTKNTAGCESGAVKITINKPIDTPKSPITQVQQINCNNPGGQIVILDKGAEYTINDGLSWQVSSTFGALAPGNYTVRLKSAMGCISDPTKVNIAVYINNTPKPVSNANQNFCIQQNAMLSDILINGTAVKWYENIAGGLSLSVSTSLIDGKTYYASQFVGGCESDRVPVTVKILATPKPTGDPLQLFCISQSSQLSNIKTMGNQIKWYPNMTSAVALPSTHIVEDGKTYYATQTVDGCESVGRLAVTTQLVSTAIPGVPLPIIANLKIENNNVTIIMQSSGVFEFSLDGTLWQTSNSFFNLESGTYTLYAREKSNICAVAEQDFTIFKIQNMFSPNGDGVNDHWVIDGIEKYPGSVIRVVDRNGMEVLNKKVDGPFTWDGYFQKRVLPTASYWYHIAITDGRVLTGFIMLKNRN